MNPSPQDASGGAPPGGPTGSLRALVVDDEAPLRRVIAGYLEREGFTVTEAADGAAAVEAARADRPDVVVLDLMMPVLDGIEACRRIRTFSDAYVVMLTARDDEVDTLVGLSVGADDYLTKPFSPRELVARIKAMLRRPRTAAAETPASRRFGDLEIDPLGREVRLAGEPVELTPTEFALLEVLSAEPRVAFTRERLLERMRESWFGDAHVVDVHVANLRRKLGEDGTRGRYIRTVRGIGYRMGEG